MEVESQSTTPAPHDDWPAVLAWAEECGLENMKGRHETATMLVKEATTTLTLVLAGFAGSLAYGVKIFDPGPAGPVVAGAVALAIYLAAIAGVLVRWCLVVDEIPAVYNEPANLAQTGYSLIALQEVEIKNIQARIKQTLKRNERIAQRVNRLRAAAIGTPLVFTVAALVNLFFMPQPPVDRSTTLRCTVNATGPGVSRPELVCVLGN